MPRKKRKIEIPSELAASTLFLSDRTCCVCCDRKKPVQLHHIDEDPSNSINENLAVLCFDCHRETQIRGGFDRKLDAAQVMLYRDDWIKRVEARRRTEHDPIRPEPINGVHLLRYLQIEESSDEQFYSFEADYALVGSAEPAADKETNVLIEAFVTRHLQRFRANAIARTFEKEEQKKAGFGATAWDSLTISHTISLFKPEILSQEFHLGSYYAGAAHPNTNTDTLNFRLHPSMQLQILNIFESSCNYLDVLSKYCIADLHMQQPRRWHDVAERIEQLKNRKDDWILRGAGPDVRNFERLSFRKYGIVIHFDPYQVGSYGEGKYEVFIPSYELKSILEEDVASLLNWR